MLTNLNTRVLLSLAAIGVAGALIIGATIAFFSDTESSVDNTFTAGALDLKVDSEAHYNGLVCRDSGEGLRWLEPVGTPPGPGLDALQALEHYNTPCEGTWAQQDLGVEHDRFFALRDIKPGDEGENTISLHVYSNDSWGRFLINGVEDLDNDCTEPESEVGLLDPECDAGTPNLPNPSGELAQNMTFYAWLDQGATPGFQNIGADGKPIDRAPDPGEGDNVWQCNVRDPREFNPRNLDNCPEPLVILPGTVDNDEGDPAPDETHNIWEALELVDAAYCPLPAPANGHNNYDYCQGIADDGRMVGSTTYYFGLAWLVPDGVGNEAQTDSLEADLSFEVVQHRNNPSKTF